MVSLQRCTTPHLWRRGWSGSLALSPLVGALALWACSAPVESSDPSPGATVPSTGGTGATPGLSTNPTETGAPGVGTSVVPAPTGATTAPTPGTLPSTPSPNPVTPAAPVAAGADVGTKAIHRLSNYQYDNTVRDLLGTTLRLGDGFVHEEAEGFDNIAASLSMSPRQLDDYFRAAGELAGEAFANPEQRALIFTCTPDAVDQSCVNTMVREFGQRAFRRPLTETEVTRLVTEYQDALGLGEDALGAMQHVVQVIVASPQFLYRIEFDPSPTDTTPHPLNSYELASRLSYALWGSMPDDTLLGLAASGALNDTATLEAEVDRMLADDKAKALIEDFAAQWLGSDRVAEHAASTTIYPSWTPELAAAMEQEMELFLAEFLLGDRPYSELLTADFNFVDANLAELYGVQPPAAAGMQRVEITDDQRRGLLGLAGFLTHTSRESRSSPIIRGKWVLDALLCQHLEVPAGLVVEPLPEQAEDDAPTTVRALIEQHREDPVCAGCHNLIDPIGLALENYDGIGRFRDVYENGLPIDTVGTLPGGRDVDSLESLSAALSEDSNFVPCVARKLNTYAMGRTITDETYLKQIVDAWQADELTLRNLIKQTVLNDTFRLRRAEGS